MVFRKWGAAAMNDLRAMMARHARDGRLAWIGLRPARRDAMVSVGACFVGEAGLEGDRSKGGTRAVTLIQAEHVAVISALVGREVLAAELRRNLVVSGINLLALKGARFSVGGAVLEMTGPCHPCSRMEEALGHGGYNAMRGHGGMCARVIHGGTLRLGDAVTPA